MRKRFTKPFLSFFSFVLLALPSVHAQDIKKTQIYVRIKKSIDAVPAIDTHEHLRTFDGIPGRVNTPQGQGLNLYSIWKGSYYPWTSRLTAWPASGNFDEWWKESKDDFDNSRALSFYRYMLPAFRDLYGVDFDSITDEQAKELNQRIFENNRNDKWLQDVITNKANIELMFIDPYWARFKFPAEYKFAVPVFNVTTLMRASHPDRIKSPLDSPYAFAAGHQLKTDTFDDFLNVIDELFQDAISHDCACLKSTQAYLRTLHYEQVSKSRAAEVYGKSPEIITEKEQKDFEDFMFWHVCKLSEKYDLPFQVHTGQARVQGSNPILLVDVIAAHPRTKFILFHGGFPWIGETGVIAMRHKNVWIDSVWLPTLSYTVGKRAYQEWLEVVPSDRIMWGADTITAEGIYAATEFTRQCLSEALAEKVQKGELSEEHAKRIGRQVMRDNALKLFPKIKRRLWRKTESTIN